MRRLSAIAAAAGHTVTGSDAQLSGHRPEYADRADLVVYTAAVPDDNCELLRARQRGIPVKSRAEFLGEIARGYKNTIAVSGSHGKTTATAMISEVFKDNDPTVHIGGEYAGFTSTSGGTEFFITEACEYKKSFLHLYPSLAVVLNTELDHTDFYKDDEAYFGAFQEFCAQSESALVFGDDPRLYNLAKKNGYVTFGLLPRNDYSAQNVVLTGAGRAFDICEQGVFLTRAELCAPGEHNLLNALAAAAAGRVYGLSGAQIAAGIARFRSVGRRFEFLGTAAGAKVYSDYAHHPTELSAMILSARELGFQKLTVVFEPHTYSRTQGLYREFARSLSAADEVYLMPVYAAREKPAMGANSGVIVREMRKNGKTARYCKSYQKVFKMLKKDSGEPSRAIVFAGAGTIDQSAREFANSAKT